MALGRGKVTDPTLGRFYPRERPGTHFKGSEVCGFNPGRGRWIFSERKNREYDFLQKGSKAVGPVS